MKTEYSQTQSSSVRRFSIHTVALILLLSLAATTRAGHFSAAWPTNGQGVWEEDGIWTTSAYPNNGHFILNSSGNPVPDANPDYDVLIDVLPPCKVSSAITVQTINIFQPAILNIGFPAVLSAKTGLGNSGQINLAGGTRFEVRTGLNGVAFSNAGVVTLNADGNGPADLVVANGSLLTNGGQILMSDNAANGLSAINDNDSFIIAQAGAIRGAGRLNIGYFGGGAHFLKFTNHGVIEANQPVNILQVGLAGQAGYNSNLVNDGFMRATGNGTLRIHAFNTEGIVFNTGGTIQAIDNGTVRLESRVTITGGVLTTSGNGTIRGEYAGSVGGTGYGGTFADILNTGTMAIGPGENFILAGTFRTTGLFASMRPAM